MKFKVGQSVIAHGHTNNWPCPKPIQFSATVRSIIVIYDQEHPSGVTKYYLNSENYEAIHDDHGYEKPFFETQLTLSGV